MARVSSRANFRIWWRLFQHSKLDHAVKSLRFSMPVMPFALLCAGCAHVDPSPDYQRASRLIGEASGHFESLQEGDGKVFALVDEMLADGLSVESAVRLCLLNNPSLQATFRNIGVARADVVQSGLFSNPTLGLSFRFPEGGGRSNFEAGLAQNIVDLWQIPIRRRAAEAALNQTILDVAQSAASLAADTQAAYFSAVAAEQVLFIANQYLNTTRQLLQIAEDRKRAGAVSDLDVNLARGPVLAAQVQVQNARLDLNNAKRRLAVLLGLAQRVDALVLLDSFPLVPETSIDTEQMVTIALESRLDLRAMEASVAEAESRVREEYRKVFPSVEVGLSFERGERRALPGRKVLADTARASVAAGQLTAPEIQSRAQRNAERNAEIDTILGPSLSLTLPIFDQNQAQIASAVYRLEQAEFARDGLQRSVIQDVRQAVNTAQTAWSVARLYETELVPQAQTTLRQSRESYSAGRTSLIVVLEAQQSLLAIQQAHVNAAQSAASTIAELERQTARPLAELSRSTTHPSALSSQPTNNEFGERQP